MGRALWGGALGGGERGPRAKQQGEGAAAVTRRQSKGGGWREGEKKGGSGVVGSL